MAKVDLTDERFGKTDRFKGRQDETTRICVLEKEVEHEVIHYLDKTRYKEFGYFACTKEGPERRCLYCESRDKRTSQTQDRFAVDIVHYRTNWDGVPDMPLEVKLEEWSFGSDKFVDLRKIQRRVGDIRSVDLTIECTDEKFQKMKITQERDAMWTKDSATKSRVVMLYQERKKKGRRDLARMTTLAEQKVILSGGTTRDMRKDAEAGPGFNSNLPDMSEGIDSTDLDALLNDVGATAKEEVSPSDQEASPPPTESQTPVPVKNGVPAQTQPHVNGNVKIPTPTEPSVDLDALLGDLEKE